MASVGVASAELIGTEASSKRRPVSGQHGTASVPTAACLTPTEYERFGEDVSKFRRGGAYSSMREPRHDDARDELVLRERKMSENFTSELNDSDIDYRHSMTERSRRICKLRSDFLKSTLQEHNSDAFQGAGSKSMQMSSGSQKSQNIEVYKFPFSGPPPPSRGFVIDEATVIDGVIDENQDPEKTERRTSGGKPKDPKELYKELMKRYSPQARPVDMTLPPTRPRVVAALSKQPSVEDAPQVLKNFGCDNTGIITQERGTRKSKSMETESDRENTLETGKNYMLQQESSGEVKENRACKESSDESSGRHGRVSENCCKPGPEISSETKENADSKQSCDESSERDDRDPEVPTLCKPSAVLNKNNAVLDDSIPTLLEKISKNPPATQKANGKKIKRKRSFLDKLLNRNKNRNK